MISGSGGRPSNGGLKIQKSINWRSFYNLPAFIYVLLIFVGINQTACSAVRSLEQRLVLDDMKNATPIVGTEPSEIQPELPDNRPIPSVGYTENVPVQTPGVDEDYFEQLIPTQTEPVIKSPVGLLVPDTVVQELVYLRDGRLFIWSLPEQQESVFLPDEADEYGEIVRYEFDLLQTRLATVHFSGMSANGVGIYSLCIWQLPEMELLSVFPDLHQVEALKFAMFRNRLAWRDAPPRGIVHLLFFDDGFTVTDLNSLQPQTLDIDLYLTWNNKGDRLVWNDNQGIWIYSVNDDRVELIANNLFQIPTIDGDSVQVKIRYLDFVWSLGDRFLLVRIESIASGIQWSGILDTTTGRRVVLPDSYTKEEPGSQAIWIATDTLAEVGCEPGSDGWMRRWSVIPTRTELRNLLSQTDFMLEGCTTESSGDGGGFIKHLMLDSQDNLVILVHNDLMDNSWLVRLDMEFLVSLNIVQVPADIEQIHWDQKAKNAILMGRHGSVLLYSTAKNELTDLLPIIKPGIKQVSWIL